MLVLSGTAHIYWVCSSVRKIEIESTLTISFHKRSYYGGTMVVLWWYYGIPTHFPDLIAWCCLPPWHVWVPWHSPLFHGVKTLLSCLWWTSSMECVPAVQMLVSSTLSHIQTLYAASAADVFWKHCVKRRNCSQWALVAWQMKYAYPVMMNIWIRPFLTLSQS